MYVCICKGVTDSAIRAAVQEGTTTISGLRKRLGCTGQCGKCKQQVRQIRNAELVNFSSVMTPPSLVLS
jgi:bacterioferritin-associated ferredoxin